MDRTRASDTERERVVDLLRDAHTHGRITLEELDERSAAAYGAMTRGELAAVIEDLPQPAAPPPPAPTARRESTRFVPVGYRAPAPPPWVRPWPGLRGWMPGWQMFSQIFSLPAGPEQAARIIITHVVPLLHDAGFERLHRSHDQLVFGTDAQLVTIDMAARDDHTEAHIWGVAPRSIRAELERLSH